MQHAASEEVAVTAAQCDVLVTQRRVKLHQTGDAQRDDVSDAQNDDAQRDGVRWRTYE